MATAITDSSIVGVVTGAYGDLVKLDDNRIVNLATFLKEQDDGSTAVIEGLIQGAYESQVLLSDGSIKALSEHVRAPGALTISGIISGAYISQAKVADGMIVNLAEKVKADEGGGSALQIAQAKAVAVFDAQMIEYEGDEYLLEKQEDETFLVSKKAEGEVFEPLAATSPITIAIVERYLDGINSNAHEQE